MNCPACGAAPGQWHVAGCVYEQCPYCGETLADCGHGHRPPLDDRVRWADPGPWIGACLAFGFFERRVGGRWEPCESQDVDSRADMARLREECRWNRREKRYERRRQAPLA